jgi:hypothetical protein
MPITLEERGARSGRAGKDFDPDGNTAAEKTCPVVSLFCKRLIPLFTCCATPFVIKAKLKKPMQFFSMGFLRPTFLPEFPVTRTAGPGLGDAFS